MSTDYANCLLCKAPPKTTTRADGVVRLAKTWKKFEETGVVICPECGENFVKRSQGVELYLIEENPEKRKEAYRYIRRIMLLVSRARNFIHNRIWKLDEPPTESSSVSVKVGKDGKTRPTFTNWCKLSDVVTNEALARIYHETRAAFPSLGSQCVAQLRQDTVAHYKDDRHACTYRCEKSWPNYQSGEAIPVYVNEFKLGWLNKTDDVPVLDIKIGEHWFKFRVRCGYRHAASLGNIRRYLRDLDAWRKEQIPPAIPGFQSMNFTLRRTNWHDNRPTVPVRNEDGKKEAARFKANIFMWLPKVPIGCNKDLVMLVTPSPSLDHLICYNVGKFNFARFSGDKLKQEVAEYWRRARRQGMKPEKLLCRIRRQRQRMQGFSDDRKAGPRAAARNLVYPRTVASRTYENIVDTVLGQIAAKLAKRAAKAGVSTVTWATLPSNPWDKEYRVPWKTFVGKLEQCLEVYNIPLQKPAAEEAAKLVAESNAAEKEQADE